MVARIATAASALALVAVLSCSPAVVTTTGSAGATPPSSVATLSPSPQAVPSRSVSSLAPAFEIDTGGLRESLPQILSDAVLWSRADIAPDGAFQSSIFEYNIANRTTEVRYTAAHGMIIQELLASESWIAWFESAQADGSDARLLALPRRGGTPRLLDDMARHRPLAIAPDVALDGADLYWSVPSTVGPTWHGALWHQTLPSGTAEMLVAPRDGFIVDWPTARGGVIAYDLTTQVSGENRVTYRGADGRTIALEAQPSSEPALGEGFIVFKRAQRFDNGDLAVFIMDNGAIRSLGAGGEPRVSGRYATWYVGRPSEVRLASPLDGCVQPIAADSLSDMILVSLPSISSGRVAWIRRDGKTTPPVDRFVVAEIPQLTCSRN